MERHCKRCDAELPTDADDGYCERCRRVEAIVAGRQTEGDAARDAERSVAETAEKAALRRRMVGCAVCNFICAGWNAYVGVSLLNRMSSSRQHMGMVFVTFAACQVLAGAVMLAVPAAWLFIVDSLIFLFCAGMNMLAVQTGGVAKVWQFVAYLQIMMMLDCWRRYRLFKSEGEGEPEVVVGDPASPEEAEEPGEKFQGLDDASAASAAGHFKGRQFVITDSEMSAILKSPDQFENVIKTQVVGIGGANETWYVVLAKGAAILFDKAREHVWSLTPGDLTMTKRGLVAKSKEDRKKLGVLQFAGQPAVWAWFAGSQEEYIKPLQSLRGPTQWSLVVWALTAGKNPALWVRWSLPFATPQEGLRLLCSDSDALDTTIGRHGIMKALKWMAACPDCAASLHERIAAVNEQRGRSYKFCAIGSCAVALVLFVVAISSSGDFGMTFHRLGFTILAGALMSCGVGLMISTAYLKKRIGCASPMSLRRDEPSV